MSIRPATLNSAVPVSSHRERENIGQPLLAEAKDAGRTPSAPNSGNKQLKWKKLTQNTTSASSLSAARFANRPAAPKHAAADLTLTIKKEDVIPGHIGSVYNFNYGCEVEVGPAGPVVVDQNNVAYYRIENTMFVARVTSNKIEVLDVSGSGSALRDDKTFYDSAKVTSEYGEIFLVGKNKYGATVKISLSHQMAYFSSWRCPR